MRAVYFKLFIRLAILIMFTYIILSNVNGSIMILITLIIGLFGYWLSNYYEIRLVMYMIYLILLILIGLNSILYGVNLYLNSLSILFLSIIPAMFRLRNIDEEKYAIWLLLSVGIIIMISSLFTVLTFMFSNYLGTERLLFPELIVIILLMILPILAILTYSQY